MEPRLPPSARLPSGDLARSRAGQATRPGGLLAVLVAGGMLSLVGFCMGSLGIAGALWQLLFPEMQRQSMQQMAGANPELIESQLAYLEFAQTMIPYQLADQMIRLAVALVMLVGLALAFRWSPRGRRLLVIAYALVIAMGCISAGLQWHIQVESTRAMESMLGGMMDSIQSSPGAKATPAPNMSGFFGGMVALIRSATLVFLIGWLLLKSAFSGWAIYYLRKPEVQRRFGADV